MPHDPSPAGGARPAPSAPPWVEPAPPWPSCLAAGLSTRLGGISPPPFDSLNLGARTGDDPAHLAANLTRLTRATGLPLARAAHIRLEHGIRIRWAEAPGLAGEADALLTNRPGLALALTVADCYPVVLGLPGRAVALLHCGWRSAADDLVGIAAEALLREAEAPADRLWAWVGPGIGPCCFEVGPEVAERFPREVRRRRPGGAGGEGRPHVDLPALLEGQLRRVGVASRRLRRDGRCTVCQRARFFSHRGDRGRTGRMLAWAMLRGPAP